MPGAAPIPNSAGFAQPDNAAVAAGNPQMAKGAGAKGAGKGFKPGGFGGLGGGGMTGPAGGGGEIVISRAEAAALTVFETEEDSVQAYRRAAEESGLTDTQIRRLKSRADSARHKGFTLKGGNIMLRPHENAGSDERGLVWHNRKEKALEDTLTAEEKKHLSAKDRAAYARAMRANKHGKDAYSEDLDKAVEQVKAKAAEGIDEDEDEPKPKGKVKKAKESACLDPETELQEVLDHVEFGTAINEMWSDAARSAAVAARKARGKGGDWRTAGRQAYIRSEAGRGKVTRAYDKAITKAVTAVDARAVGRAEVKRKRFESLRGKNTSKVHNRMNTSLFKAKSAFLTGEKKNADVSRKLWAV